MLMFEAADIREWRGHDVVDDAGRKIGTLESVYVDTSTDEPSFATVTVGLPTRHRLVFVPLEAATVGPGYLKVRYPRNLVKGAPSIDTDGELPAAEEESVFKHYNLVYQPGAGGERRLWEIEIPWLPGYEASSPVRIGNLAFQQFQLDVYGEMLDAMCQARSAGLEADEVGWRLGRAFVNFLETAWDKPDEGIWEVRGPRRHFTHSRMMAWVAVDRAVKLVERFGREGPVERWRSLRDTIHEQVCREGFSTELGAFVQYYGSKTLDASLLMMPLVGFLPASDPRVRSTVAAIERRLLRDGFVQRYENDPGVDGLPPGEGAFLPCTFWLADNYALLGRAAEAERIFERLLGLCNDVGLLSEEYDPQAKRLVGNFPQAFSHVGLINTAMNLAHGKGPAQKRR